MILLILILTAAILFAAILLGVYRIAFHVPKKEREERPHDIPSAEQYRPERERMLKLVDDLLAIPCERVTVRSFDGLELGARYYHTSDTAPVQIQVHGYRGSAIRDFCGGCPIALEMGFNVLLIDQRGHGQSEGHVITFGIEERRDVLAWIDYIRDRLGKNVPIVLAGVSMGAATVLSCMDMDLPENVRGVIADCPFSDPQQIIAKVGRDMRLPSGLMMPVVRLAAKWIGRFDLTESSALESVKRTRLPALIIHGEDDRFVPCGMSRALKQANPDGVTLETFPGAGHGLSYILDEPRYAGAIRDFVKRLNLL